MGKTLEFGRKYDGQQKPVNNLYTFRDPSQQCESVGVVKMCKYGILYQCSLKRENSGKGSVWRRVYVRRWDRWLGEKTVTDEPKVNSLIWV